MKNFDVTIKKDFCFDAEDIESIVTTALEGGIGYWACLDNDTYEFINLYEQDMNTSEIAAKILVDGGTLEFSGAEDNDEYFEPLTIDMLLQGIKLAIQDHDWDGDMWNVDGIVADNIFQLALFGEIVYG